jgi:hypothetical protein
MSKRLASAWTRPGSRACSEVTTRWGAMADSWDEGGELAATTFDGDRFLKLLDEGIKD